MTSLLVEVGEGCNTGREDVEARDVERSSEEVDEGGENVVDDGMVVDCSVNVGGAEGDEAGMSDEEAGEDPG